IPIFKEEELETLIKKYDVDECVFAYSDVHYTKVMQIGARVNSAGANFKLLGLKDTQLKSSKPVISVCATRTGTGKSQTSRKVVGGMLLSPLARCNALTILLQLCRNAHAQEEYSPNVSEAGIIFPICIAGFIPWMVRTNNVSGSDFGLGASTKNFHILGSES